MTCRNCGAPLDDFGLAGPFCSADCEEVGGDGEAAITRKGQDHA